MASTQYIKEKSSSERCCYVRSEQMDLFHAIAKNLIQSWRVYRLEYSLLIFNIFSLSVKGRGRLISYIPIYLLFPSSYHIFFFELAGKLKFHLWRWNMTFQIRRWRNLADVPSKYSQHKVVDPYLSSISQTSCSRKNPSRWKNTHTHTYTHTQTHTHTHTTRHLNKFLWDTMLNLFQENHTHLF